MIPKDKGWGMSNLGLWGGKPICFHLVFICHLPLSHPTSSMLVLLVRAVIAKWWWVWQDYPSLPTCPLHQRILPLHVAGAEGRPSIPFHSLHYALPPLLVRASSLSVFPHALSTTQDLCGLFVPHVLLLGGSYGW